MLTFNRSRARNRVNNKNEIFEVRSSIEIPRKTCSGLGQTLTMTGYSSQLTQFTQNRSSYNSIMILLTTIGCPLIFLVCSVLGRSYKQLRFDCCNQRCVILYTKQDLYQQNRKYFCVYTEIQQELEINDIVKKYENICVYNIYLIVLVPAFNQTYEKQGHIEKINMSS